VPRLCVAYTTAISIRCDTATIAINRAIAISRAMAMSGAMAISRAIAISRAMVMSRGYSYDYS